VNFDYDFLVVGSGFGGSVSALRLVEKGWRVGVMEQGRRIGPALSLSWACNNRIFVKQASRRSRGCPFHLFIVHLLSPIYAASRVYS
jgi:choline dehydrogenase-like flavoprotein